LKNEPGRRGPYSTRKPNNLLSWSDHPTTTSERSSERSAEGSSDQGVLLNIYNKKDNRAYNPSLKEFTNGFLFSLASLKAVYLLIKLLRFIRLRTKKRLDLIRITALVAAQAAIRMCEEGRLK
ncbi:hypothetical protein V8F20_012861, partial [Naviculisporaceae sp. PSN 640]